MEFFRNRTPRAIALALRIALGGVFVYAAYVKLKDPWQMFAMSIDSYQLLPMWGVTAVARVLPWVELALGLLLIVGRWLRTAAIAASLMLAVFFGLMVRADVTGMEINCGCFGPGEVISWKTLVRDGALLAASLYVTAMAVSGTARLRRKPGSTVAAH
jgi:uncharacterized membrane protein YphA (DoxX/SURF4 family)